MQTAFPGLSVGCQGITRGCRGLHWGCPARNQRDRPSLKQYGQVLPFDDEVTHEWRGLAHLLSQSDSPLCFMVFGTVSRFLAARAGELECTAECEEDPDDIEQRKTLEEEHRLQT